MSKLPKIDLDCYWSATGRAESTRVNPFTRPLNPAPVLCLSWDKFFRRAKRRLRAILIGRNGGVTQMMSQRILTISDSSFAWTVSPSAVRDRQTHLAGVVGWHVQDFKLSPVSRQNRLNRTVDPSIDLHLKALKSFTTATAIALQQSNIMPC